MESNYIVLKSCKDCIYLIDHFDPDWYEDYYCNYDDKFKDISKYIERHYIVINNWMGMSRDDQDAEEVELSSIIGQWQKDHRVNICGICNKFQEKTKKKVPIVKNWFKFDG